MIDDKVLMKSLTDQDLKMATSMYFELESEGVYLPQTEKDEIQEIRAEIRELENSFSHNCFQSVMDESGMVYFPETIVKHALQSVENRPKKTIKLNGSDKVINLVGISNDLQYKLYSQSSPQVRSIVSDCIT